MLGNDNHEDSKPVQLVEEFVSNELVSEDVAERAERLCEEGKPYEALHLVLGERRETGTFDPSTTNGGSDPD